MIQIELYGKPACWSASRQGKHGFFDLKSKEKEYARWQIKSQYRDNPLTGPIVLDFIFFVPIPKNTSKALKAQMIRRVVLPTTPDTTNMQKLYEDCLQGIVIENDRQVNRISSVRYYSENPGILITIRRWDEVIGNPNFVPQKEAQHCLI